MSAMSTLSVNIYEAAGTVVIKLDGEAGIKAADGLQVPLQRITGARPPVVVFDLQGLLFAASLFLGLLVNFRRGLVSHGTKIQMAAVPPNIRELFEVTRLEDLFEFVESAPLPPAESSF
jgi:anti-anti-sigma factor